MIVQKDSNDSTDWSMMLKENMSLALSLSMYLSLSLSLSLVGVAEKG